MRRRGAVLKRNGSGVLGFPVSYENAIINAYLALMAHNITGKLISPAHPLAFSKKDGSPAQRLNAAYNALKHFHGKLAEGVIATAPVWLVEDGIEHAGPDGEQKLRFDELIELLRELEQDGRFLAEQVFDMA
jgi:hypothetical protein